MRYFYSLLCYLLAPLVFGYFLFRGLREPGYVRGWSARLGLAPKRAACGIWVHAASVGEVQAALPIVHALQRRYPEKPCCMTVFTPTGLASAQKALGDEVPVFFLPLDMPGATRRFIRRLAPALGIIVETELWPNLLHQCRRNQVPVMLANARLSEKSARHYASWPLRGMMRAAVANLARIAVASEEDAERFRQLGATEAQLVDTGNLKFEVSLPEDTAQRGEQLRALWQATERPVWVAASTHHNEEARVLEALSELRRSHPDLLLVLVPRHPQRFETVAKLCRERGYKVSRHSRKEVVSPDTDLVLGDTLGDLPAFFASADLAFVGGSLVPGIGGHNLLEPAALRLPIITGIHVDGWVQVADWLEQAGALCRVADTPALVQAVSECVDDHNGRMMAGLSAVRVVESHGGALERTLRLIPPLLTPAG